MNNHNYNTSRRLPSRQPQQLEAQPASAAEEPALKFGEIWDTIRRGKWVILGTTVLVTLAVALYTFALPHMYEAVSVVSVDTRVPEREPGAAILQEQRSLASEQGKLQYSVDIASRVVEGIEEAARETGEDADFPILRSEEGDTLSDRLIVQRLWEKVEFTELPTRSMITISARSESPEETAVIANLYAQKYEAYSREQARESISASIDYLEEQVAKQEDELNSLSTQFAAFARENDLLVEGQGGDRLVNEYAALSSQRRQLQSELARERTALGIAQSRLEEAESGVGGSVQDQQAIQQTQQSIEAIETKISGLEAELAEYYANDPSLRGNEDRTSDTRELKRRIDGLTAEKRRLTEQLAEQTSASSSSEQGTTEEVASLQQRIREHKLNISTLEEQIASLNREVGGALSQLESVPGQGVERDQLQRKVSYAEQAYGELQSELKRLQLKKEGELGYVSQVREANTPLVPVSPNIQQNLLLGILLGLGFGLGLAFVRQAANDHLHTPEELQEKGYNLIGVIPRMDREIKASFEGKDRVEVEGKSLNTHLMPLLNPWSPISENYRLVRTNLQYSAGGDGQGMPRVLLMTSPEAADGKTTTAVNLAITMAQSGRRVLLIDADLRRPNTHQLLDLPLEPGLADLLSEERLLSRDGGDTSSGITPTEVNNLHYLPAGRTDVPPAEMLGSEHMKELLNGLRSRYDLIIIDSPPVLSVSDPVLLATQCDATLVVVSAERTDLKALEVTRRTLEAVGVPIAGTIFNRFEMQKASGYGYGYRYDDEYGYTRATV